MFAFFTSVMLRAPIPPLPQAYLVQAPQGNILWDCVGVLHPDAAAELQAMGGISAIAISHPHFYNACVDWAEPFDCQVQLGAARACLERWAQCGARSRLERNCLRAADAAGTPEVPYSLVTRVPVHVCSCPSLNLSLHARFTGTAGLSARS